MTRNRQTALLISVLIGVPALVIGGIWIHHSGDVIAYSSIDGGALVSANGRTISVTAVGQCDQTVSLVADEEQASVSIAVKYAEPRTPTCAGMPGYAVYHVHLSQPLGPRKLLDRVSGKPVSFIDVATVLRPTYVPPGYKFRYDAPDGLLVLNLWYARVYTEASVACSQLYTNSRNYAALVITQSAPGTLEWPPKARPHPVIVNGHQGLEAPGQLTWIERGQRIAITTGGVDLSASELLAVADSMPR